MSLPRLIVVFNVVDSSGFQRNVKSCFFKLEAKIFNYMAGNVLTSACDVTRMGEPPPRLPAAQENLAGLCYRGAAGCFQLAAGLREWGYLWENTLLFCSPALFTKKAPRRLQRGWRRGLDLSPANAEDKTCARTRLKLDLCGAVGVSRDAAGEICLIWFLF